MNSDRPIAIPFKVHHVTPYGVNYWLRSDVEKRWAIFFDELGFKYIYELNGYKQSDKAKPYRPDFRIDFDHISTLWIETKGPRGIPQREIGEKIAPFVAAILPDEPVTPWGNVLYMPCGYPGSEQLDCYMLGPADYMKGEDFYWDGIATQGVLYRDAELTFNIFSHPSLPLSKFDGYGSSRDFAISRTAVGKWAELYKVVQDAANHNLRLIGGNKRHNLYDFYADRTGLPLTDLSIHECLKCVQRAYTKAQAWRYEPVGSRNDDCNPDEYPVRRL